MILKKIPVDQEKAAKKSKATNIGDLTDYVSVPDDAARLTRLGYHITDDGEILGGDGEQPEKLLYLTTRGFNTTTFKGQQAEMIALAMECPKSKHPVQHWVASWHEGEQPSPEQVEEFLDVFLAELGLQKHQVIAAVHRDTDNIHCHIAVNKVSSDTYKVVKPAKGWDIEAAHRTVAIVEHRQGWQSEPNGRYTVLDSGQVARVGELESKPRKPSRAGDMERQTGRKSVATIAIEEAGELIRAADSWAGLHEALAARGMRYVKEGSGAKIYLADQPVKASTAGHWCSLPKLTKRLGSFEPAAGTVVPVPRKSEPIRPDMPGFDDYDSARMASKADRQRKIQEARERHTQERDSLKAEQVAIRADIAGKDWRGKGETLNAMRSVTAANRKKTELELQERQRRELEAIKAQFPAWPPYEEWLRTWYSPTEAHDYRYHRHEPLRIEGDGEIEARPRDLRAFIGEVVGSAVEYRRAEGGGGVSLASFTDHGRRIDVQEAYDQEAALAALQLGAAKWGGKVRLYGSDAYQAMCVKLAVEHGIQISNPELQEQIATSKEARRKAREEALRIPQAKLFDAYQQAVQADRYSVTAIKMTATEHKAFLLKPKEGLEPSVVERRMQELVKIQSRGENVYYTPRSERMHHVLIDDLTEASLQRLLADGYRPAVVLESSPAKFQVILNVQKLGIGDDRIIGNRLCQQLNKLYGDPNLTGVIHPHRAPGFDNRKWELGAPAPKYQREDGSFPTVVLHHAEHCTCDRALALSCVVARELDEEARAVKSRPSPVKAVPVSALPDDAYQVHYRDIVARHKSGTLDLSRVDAMIAERMRMTGHAQAEIQVAIEACAPSIRPTPEARNWSDYAERTAAYAYSLTVDRKLPQLERYRDQFLRLEGRDPTHEHAHDSPRPTL